MALSALFTDAGLPTHSVIVLGMGFRGTVDALDPDAGERVRPANLAFIRDANVQAVETNAIYTTLTKGR